MKLAAIVCLVTAGSFLLAAPAHAGYTHTWNAGSAAFPDADCFWHISTPDPGQATFAGGRLNVTTPSVGDALIYYQADGDLSIPDPWVIETKMQLGVDSGTSTFATCAGIGFATAPDVENILFIGNGSIYLWGSGYVKGPEAFVDTQLAPHTYRIEVTGAGAVSVFYDGVLTLTGSTFLYSGFEDTTYLWWADGTSYASGTSYWDYFTHNGNALESCPTPVKSTSWGRLKNAYR